MHPVSCWDHRIRVRLLNALLAVCLVVRVQLLHVQAISSMLSVVVVPCLVNCRRSVPLLCVQLPSIRSVRTHRVVIVLVICQSVSRRVVAEVGLVHKLLVETRGNWDILSG